MDLASSSECTPSVLYIYRRYRHYHSMRKELYEPIARARQALLALAPQPRLKLCLEMIGQVIPAMIDDTVRAGLSLKVDELTPRGAAPLSSETFTSRAMAFIAGHPGVHTAQVAEHIDRPMTNTNSLLQQKRRTGALERRA